VERKQEKVNAMRARFWATLLEFLEFKFMFSFNGCGFSSEAQLCVCVCVCACAMSSLFFMMMLDVDDDIVFFLFLFSLVVDVRTPTHYIQLFSQQASSSRCLNINNFKISVHSQKVTATT